MLLLLLDTLIRFHSLRLLGSQISAEESRAHGNAPIMMPKTTEVGEIHTMHEAIAK